MGQAMALARWIGNGRRQVTSGQVLRKTDALAAGAALGVDVPPKLRANWEHEVTLEKTLAQKAGRKYPVCVAFRADSPVEYWSGDEEDAAEPEPFDLAEVNKRLSGLG